MGTGAGQMLAGGVGAADAISVDSEARGQRIEVIAGVGRNRHRLWRSRKEWDFTAIRC
jgi:hypothetical protein